MQLRQAVFGMAALGNILPALPAAGEDARREAHRALQPGRLRLPITGAADLALASPVLGAGVPSTWSTACSSARRAAKRRHRQGERRLATSGLKLRKGDKILESAADIEAHVKDRAQFFFADFLPFLKMLGVAD